MFQAAAAPTEPMKKSASEITSSRSFPYWSPSLPRIGVATDATSRKTVRTQVTQVVVVWRSSLQGRQGRDDHRLLQCERDPGQREDRERHVVVLALGFHWARQPTGEAWRQSSGDSGGPTLT